MLSRIKLPVLVAIAGGCGMGLGVMMVMLRRQQNEFASKAHFVKTAADILTDQPIASEMLGRPFIVGRANLDDGWSKMGENYVQVRLPVTGQKDKALMWAYAKRDQEDNKIKLFKLEVTFDKVPGRKMILLEGEDSKDEQPETPPSR